MKIIKINLNDAEQAVKNNDGYCPCKLFKTKDTKCMCKQFRDQIAQNIAGECECGLYKAMKED